MTTKKEADPELERLLREERELLSGHSVPPDIKQLYLDVKRGGDEARRQLMALAFNNETGKPKSAIGPTTVREHFAEQACALLYQFEQLNSRL